jgi:hypothetical protein
MGFAVFAVTATGIVAVMLMWVFLAAIVPSRRKRSRTAARMSAAPRSDSFTLDERGRHSAVSRDLSLDNWL